MLVIGELGFRVVLVFIFVVFPVFGLIIRRKWRIEVVRREEISRLLVLAAEESARAELEASIGYGYRVELPLPPPVVPRQRVCAVCCEPTYNRCSRCKLVHYCSGKCQIIHWRQGHKDECRPSPAGSGEASPFVGNALKKPYFNEGEDALEGHRFSSLFSDGLSVEDDGSSLDNFLHGEEPVSVSVLHDSSASFGVSTSIPGHGTCIDESTSDDDSLHDLNLESYDSSSTVDSFETASSDSHLEQIKSVEEKTHTRVNNDASISVLGGMKDETFHGKIDSLSTGVSHSDKNYVGPSISTSGFWDGTLDTSRTKKQVPRIIVKSKPIGVGNRKLPDLKSNMPDRHSKVSETVRDKTGTARTAKLVTGTISSNKESVTHIRLQIPALSSFKEPDTVIKGADESRIKSVKNGVSTDTLKDISLQSSSSTANHLDRNNQKTQKSLLSQKIEFLSSGSKGHNAPVSKSLEANGNTSMPPQVARSIPSASVGLKSSVLKVYEQFRAPRSSKQGDDVGINGEKAIFAYDLFVKLYHWNKVELLPCGLVNCGNSCYANVVLQCLAFTPPVTAYLLQGLHSKICKKKEWCFTCEFERLILKANEVGYPQSPIGILSQIQKIGSHLTNGREEDAHEFLRYAVETMQSICLQEAEVKTSSSLEEETTLVGLTFGGYLRSKIKCTRCHGKSKKHERMMDLTVEIEGDVETLEDALQRFTGTESLDGENKYHCGRCKSYEKAKKKLNILEAPNVLTIALKRFQSGKFGKLNKSIRFPEILNLAPYMRGGSDKAPIYRLYGVVVHLDIMNASFSGHYVCYVRNAQNKWFKIDDSTVKPVDLDQVLNKGAYMLFYSRCSPRAPRSIRSTIISRDLPIKIENPTVNSSRSNGNTSTSRQRDLSANHIPDNLGNLSYVHQVETRVTPLHIYGVDSSSDDSSPFHSDEVSTSTDSTRDSISADDISDYIFGYNAFSRSSDLDTSSSSSSSSSSPLYTTHSSLSNSERYASALPEHNVLLTNNGKAHHETGRAKESSSEGGVTFLYSNSSSKQVRNLVNINSRDSRETDSKRLGSANPLDYGKSGVHLRQLSRKKAD